MEVGNTHYFKLNSNHAIISKSSRRVFCEKCPSKSLVWKGRANRVSRKSKTAVHPASFR